MKQQQKCYDFPMLVIHRTGCPRYTGGVCHPEPTPEPPLSDEDAAVWHAYHEFMAGRIQPIAAVPASGSTGVRRDQLQ